MATKEDLIFSFWEKFFYESDSAGRTQVLRDFNINSDAHGLNASFTPYGTVELTPAPTEKPAEPSAERPNSYIREVRIRGGKPCTVVGSF
ncbi:hypothetical protein Barb6_02488 [Bacteroidales bacterium Barb6]|nr:hypothetical protein Barb6_02488 [Bacteroidales bacterium Barb6]